MKISDIMTPSTALVTPEDNIKDACEKMSIEDVGFLPVCDGEKIRGVITDRDVAIRGVAKNYNPNDCKVRDIMSPDVIYVFEDQDSEEALRLMEEQQIRRLVVLSRNKKLVGVLSLGDVSTRFRDQKRVGKTLEGISMPGGQHAV
ncbi:MAG: CBS domain-containing protein [Oligoflexales bacterium]